MKTKMVRKLKAAEVKSLEQFIDRSGGQVRASVILGCSPATLSRTINRHHATSALLIRELVSAGVITT